MMKLYWILMIVLFTALTGSCLQSQSSAVKTEAKWYGSVPETERQAFLSQFEQAIILRKDGAWSDLYDRRYNHDNETKQ